MAVSILFRGRLEGGSGPTSLDKNVRLLFSDLSSMTTLLDVVASLSFMNKSSWVLLSLILFQFATDSEHC